MFSIKKNKNVIKVSYLNEEIWMPLNNPLEIRDIPILEEIQLDDVTCINKSPDFDAYTIYMTRKCNYSCSYCFVKRNAMDSVVHIDDLLHFIEIRGKKKIQVRFFGGEPLLRTNEIKKWVDRFGLLIEQGYFVSYSIVTNGSLLDMDTVKYFYDKRFIVILSHELDHDLQKRNRVADDSLQEKAFLNLKNLAQTKLVHRSTIRCMLEPNVSVSILERFKYAVEMGIGGVQFDIPHVPADSNHRFTHKAIDELKKQIEEVTMFYLKKMEERDFQYFGLHNIDNLLKIWILHDKYIDYDTCGFGINHFSIDVDGLVYPCQNFAGIAGFCIGDVITGLNRNTFDTSIERHISCTKCCIKELCTKRCYYSNYIGTNNIYEPTKAQCEMKKEFIAAAIYILYKLRQNPQLFDDYCVMLKAKNKFFR